jgi:hypothetical protein
MFLSSPTPSSLIRNHGHKHGARAMIIVRARAVLFFENIDHAAVRIFIELTLPLCVSTLKTL